MTIEQALDYPGELVAIWDWGASGEKLLVCSVADGKLTVMASKDLSKAERERWSAELRGKGVRQGATSGAAPFYWSNDGTFTVWALTDTVVTSISDTIKTAGGARIHKADVAQVWTFLDAESLGHRGVRAVIRSGAPITIAEEEDPAAQLDPTYGLDNVQIDAAWATFMGRDLAAWLGVQHVDDMA
ncbi:MAG: hypothetical protein AB7S68_13405 [Polyangiaceae bacterium]